MTPRASSPQPLAHATVRPRSATALNFGAGTGRSASAASKLILSRSITTGLRRRTWACVAATYSPTTAV